ncbi:TetR/AcrR family transcriptional regulator [Nocardioides sp.]|uniref:TetR/AcrR family transcriptional regulator n=1 Tax=Nocardioides sp. TaxID=35761 RepID=UPI0035276241
MPDAPGIRARNRAALEAEIMAVAGRHLASYGAAALSLRAIARELGMASSAIYRYVESRDELLTRLIIAAFDSLGDAVDADLEALPAEAAPLDRFRAIASATRHWAIRHPHEFALIYGSPVPGYHAPPERTQAAGTRVPLLLLGTLSDGDVPEPTEAEIRALGRMAQDEQLATFAVGPGQLRRGVTAWILVIGAITAELFEQFGRDTYEPDAFFDLILDDAQRIVTG